MNNFLLQVKVKQRLNKLASGDYDNIEPWQIIEAFNKVQLEWVRDQLYSLNPTREGDEQSRKRVDDLQRLLVKVPLHGTNKPGFFESVELPENYLSFKRVSGLGTHPPCRDAKQVRVDLAEEGNAEDLLRDTNTRPDWNWAETFCTLSGNKIKVYTGNHFSILSATLTYYRYPHNIKIAGVIDPASGNLSVKDISCELKEDVVELLVDLTAAQLAGDLEMFHQLTRTTQQAVNHN